MSEALNLGNEFKQDPILVMPGGGDELLMGGSQFLHKVKSDEANEDEDELVLLSVFRWRAGCSKSSRNKPDHSQNQNGKTWN